MASIEEVKVIDFPQLGDSRGQLIVAEGERDIPFALKRVFYICGTQPGVVRGQHANRKSEFVIINVAGKSKVKCMDGKGHEKIVALDRPNLGVYLPTMIWKEMYDFTPDSVMLVLSSEHYDAAEYVRKYEDFLRIVREETPERKE